MVRATESHMTAALTNGELMFTLDFHPIMANSAESYVLPTVLAAEARAGERFNTGLALGCSLVRPGPFETSHRG
jgi:hypothetical protein